MAEETIANSNLAPIWSVGFFIWLFWGSFKINAFWRRTRRQRAISTPQLRRLRIQLFLSTSVIFFTGFFLFLAPLIRLYNFEGIFRTSLICLIPMIFWTFGVLQSHIKMFQRAKFPFTDQKEVPIPKPPPSLPPLPYDGKSFEYLSKELDQAMRDLEKKR